MTHLWESKHGYYCTEGQYFSTQERCQTIYEYKSFGEFLQVMGDADNDMNLLFRWDWKEGADWEMPEYNGDDYYRHAKLLLFFMMQRKGYHQTHIVDVCRADEPAILEYLRPKLAHLRSLWEPLE